MIRCCITAGVLVWQLIPAVIAAPVPPEPVSPTPGADARRAARVAYELGQRSEALPLRLRRETLLQYPDALPKTYYRR